MTSAPVPDSVKADSFRSRRLARLAANPSGAIYGTIVATAVTAAASAHDETPARIAAANVLTLLVFWLAHVYSEVLAHRLRGAEFRVSVVRTTMANELPMIEAPALSIVFLLLGALGLLDDQLAINLALANGVAQLFIWGIVVARRLGWSWPASALSGVVDASFAVVIILLKALLH